MKIILARKAGFCMGVRRAMDTALRLANNSRKPVYTPGPLIHNPQAVELLRRMGVTPVDSPDRVEGGILLVRAHGLTPELLEAYRSRGFEIVNGTCPRVLHVQGIIKRHSTLGYRIAIVGDRGHPEVVGLMGYAASPIVISSLEEAQELPPGESPLCIVAQTTQERRAFEKISRLLISKNPGSIVFDTICDSTKKRQDEIEKLASECDIIVIVGGRNSANTLRLAELAKQHGKQTVLVEKAEELEKNIFSGVNSAGVSAGASTPNWLIQGVLETLEGFSLEKLSLFKKIPLKLLRFLSDSGLLIMLGAFFFSISLQLLTGFEKYDEKSTIIAATYIFSVHILNRYAEFESFRLNHPLRSLLLSRYWLIFIPAAFLLLFLAFSLSFLLRREAFITLVFLSLLGLIYPIRFIPLPFSNSRRVFGFRDIPAFRTVFTSLDKAFATALVPSMSTGFSHKFAEDPLNGTIAVITAFVTAFLFYFVRQTFFDLRDVQGDGITGNETLPLIIGHRRTRRLIMSLLLASVLLLSAASICNATVPQISLLLIMSAFYLAFATNYSFYACGYHGYNPEFAVEAIFIATGILSLFSKFFF